MGAERENVSSTLVIRRARYSSAIIDCRMFDVLPVVRLQVADDDAVHVERRRGQDAPSERIKHARRVVPD